MAFSVDSPAIASKGAADADDVAAQHDERNALDALRSAPEFQELVQLGLKAK